MTAWRNREDGFSLIELLVSLALLSLMAVFALDAYGTMRDMNRLASRYEDGLEAEQVLQHLRGEIGGALAVLENSDGGQPMLVFDGKPGSLAFIAIANGDRETGGLYRVSYFVNDEKELVSKRQMYRPGQQLPVYTVTLLRGVEAVTFRYVGDEGGDGQEYWAEPQRLPRGVKVNVEFVEGDPRRPVQTIIALHSAR